MVLGGVKKGVEYLQIMTHCWHIYYVKLCWNICVSPFRDTDNDIIASEQQIFDLRLQYGLIFSVKSAIIVATSLQRG